MYYGKCNYGKNNYGKNIMANETEPIWILGYECHDRLDTNVEKDGYEC